MAAVTTTAGLFAPIGWLSILLFLPSMLSFAFLLPWGFGAAHLVAGQGREAMASSLVLIGSGLLGPALGPLIVASGYAELAEAALRSEEHTSELQSLMRISYAVFCLKKKTNKPSTC